MSRVTSFIKRYIRKLRRRFQASPLYLMIRKLDIQLRPHHWTNNTPPDFLIIGLQKCGTYWLTALLDSHPEITALPSRPGGKTGIFEGHFFDFLGVIDTDRARYSAGFNTKHNRFFFDLVFLTDILPRNDLLQRFAKRYNAYLQNQKIPDTRLVGDKTTEYVFHLELIDYLYEGVKKICILRDPRDRIVSFHFQQVRKKEIDNNAISDEEVEAYCDRIIQELSNLITYSGNLHILTYEHLLRATPDVAKGILSYLEVDTSDTIITQCISEASFENLTGRNRGQNDPDSHFRKGIAGDWKLHLSAEQINYTHEKVGGLLGELATKYQLDLQFYFQSDSQ